METNKIKLSRRKLIAYSITALKIICGKFKETAIASFNYNLGVSFRKISWKNSLDSVFGHTVPSLVFWGLVFCFERNNTFLQEVGLRKKLLVVIFVSGSLSFVCLDCGRMIGIPGPVLVNCEKKLFSINFCFYIVFLLLFGLVVVFLTHISFPF